MLQAGLVASVLLQGCQAYAPMAIPLARCLCLPKKPSRGWMKPRCTRTTLTAAVHSSPPSLSSSQSHQELEADTSSAISIQYDWAVIPRNAGPLQGDTLGSLLAMLNCAEVVKIGLMVEALKDLLIWSNWEVKVKSRVGKDKTMQAAKQTEKENRDWQNKGGKKPQTFCTQWRYLSW